MMWVAICSISLVEIVRYMYIWSAIVAILYIFFLLARWIQRIWFIDVSDSCIPTPRMHKSIKTQYYYMDNFYTIKPFCIIHEHTKSRAQNSCNNSLYYRNILKNRKYYWRIYSLIRTHYIRCFFFKYKYCIK